MAITIEELAKELGVGVWRIQRWVGRKLGHSITTEAHTQLPPDVVRDVRDQFRKDSTAAPAPGAISTARATAIAYECPSCHRTTRANRVTGACYSHNIPDTVPVRICPVSGTHAIDPDPTADRLPPVPLTPPRPQGHSDDVSSPIYPVNENRPWREIPSGLPGLGHHRHGR